MSISVNGNRVVFIGAGNVATHLAPAIDKEDNFSVVQVYSRTIDSAKALAGRLAGAMAVDSIAAIDMTADIYIVSLADDAVESVISGLAHSNDALWLHTSGSLPKEVLKDMSSRYGVIYPLQTFSKDTDVDMSRVPVFVEGSSPEVEDSVFAMARGFTGSVYRADGDLRRKMHVAAVFACNFTNYLWTVADDLLKEEGLSLAVLHPLLEETLRKAETVSPAEGQTGPAKRGDKSVMEKHISMLSGDLASIYRELSSAIYKYHHGNE